MLQIRLGKVVLDPSTRYPTFHIPSFLFTFFFFLNTFHLPFLSVTETYWKTSSTYLKMSILMQGILLDGTIIAVKQLSPKSKQGNREFVNEIGMISALQHPNVVRLYGCCIEGNQLFLVYEYMENNSLARALFGKLKCFYFSILC
jgi:serine/threonine protein kinase